jgi:hypothetical protein
MLVQSAESTSTLGVPSRTLEALTTLHFILAGETVGATEYRSATMERFDAAGALLGNGVVDVKTDVAAVGDLGAFLHEIIFLAPRYQTNPTPLGTTHDARTTSSAFAGAIGANGVTEKRKKDVQNATEPVAWNGVDTAQLLTNALTFIGQSLASPGSGLVPRAESELLPNDPDSSRLPQHFLGGVSALGGFTEASGAMEFGSATASFLALEALEQVLPPDLFTMWRDARSAWLALVKRDWDKMFARNPQRDDFSWANKSDMNTAFFDLCDVGSGVMLCLLEKETATPREEARFFLAFAAHLHEACRVENKMHRDAMSMKKLNVKLKDHRFGGTRYFTDQSPEEQQRRLARKARIMEARKRNGGMPISRRGGGGADGKSWLDFDHFDYQTEERAVKFDAAQGLPPAAGHAQSSVGSFAQHRAHRTVALSRLEAKAPGGPAPAKKVAGAQRTLTELLRPAASPASQAATEPTVVKDSGDCLSILVLTTLTSKRATTARDIADGIAKLDACGQAELWRRLAADGGWANAGGTPPVAKGAKMSQPELPTLFAAATVSLVEALRQSDEASLPAVGYLRWTVSAKVAIPGLDGRGIAGDAQADAKMGGYGTRGKRPRPADGTSQSPSDAAGADSDDDAAVLLGSQAASPTSSKAPTSNKTTSTSPTPAGSSSASSVGTAELRVSITVACDGLAVLDAEQPLLPDALRGPFDVVILNGIASAARDAADAQRRLNTARHTRQARSRRRHGGGDRSGARSGRGRPAPLYAPDDHAGSH